MRNVGRAQTDTHDTFFMITQSKNVFLFLFSVY